METSHLAQPRPSTQQLRFPPSMLATLGPRPHMRTPSTLPQEDTMGHSPLAIEARCEPHAAAFQRMHTTWPSKPSRNHARDLLPAQHAGNLGRAFACTRAQTPAPRSAGAYFRLNTLATSAARARSSCAGSARRGLGEAPNPQAQPSPGPYFRLNTLATSAARARSSCAGSARRGLGEAPNPQALPSPGPYFRLNTLATSAARARSSCAGSARRGLGEAPTPQALPSPGPYFRLNTLATSAARARSSCAGSARRGSGEGWWCGRLWWRVPSPALGKVGISARSLGSGCSLNLRHTPTELKCVYTFFHMKVLPWSFCALHRQQTLPDPESYAYRVGGHADMTLYVRALAWMLAHVPLGGTCSLDPARCASEQQKCRAAVSQPHA